MYFSNVYFFEMLNLAEIYKLIRLFLLILMIFRVIIIICMKIFSIFLNVYFLAKVYHFIKSKFLKIITSFSPYFSHFYRMSIAAIRTFQPLFRDLSLFFSTLHELHRNYLAWHVVVCRILHPLP